MLASLFCFLIYLCRHTRRLCLPFFPCWVDLLSMAFLYNRYLLARMTGVSALLRRFGSDDQSHYFLVTVKYHCTVITRSRRWWSICLIYTWNRSRVVFLLNFCFAYLPFLVKDGSDKPITSWCSLYIVGRTWEKLKSVQVWTMQCEAVVK